MREFCRHTHNPPDSCAHKHVRVRSTNKRLKPNDAVEGPSADEGETLRSLLALCVEQQVELPCDS